VVGLQVPFVTPAKAGVQAPWSPTSAATTERVPSGAWVGVSRRI
jgi:hypothetical protein